MLRTISSLFFYALATVLVMTLSPASIFAGERKPETRLPLKQLFSHKSHLGGFKTAGVTCTDCHNFAVKSTSFDPLAKNVGAGHLVPSRMVCHECHLGKIELPRVNQCSLCHKDPEKLKPQNHNLAWKQRHGSMAQLDPDSCNSCHQENQNSCTNCHTQRNPLKPMVHRPNFRLTHAVEARANPAKCAICHTNLSTCMDCHKGGIKK